MDIMKHCSSSTGLHINTANQFKLNISRTTQKAIRFTTLWFPEKKSAPTTKVFGMPSAQWINMQLLHCSCKDICFHVGQSCLGIFIQNSITLQKTGSGMGARDD